MKKHLNLVILIIVAVMALVILGITYWQLVKESKSFDWQKFSFIPRHSNTSIDTSDWLTYRNEVYGWEIKYPKDWYTFNIDSPTKSTVYLSDGGSIAKKNKTLSYEEIRTKVIDDYMVLGTNTDICQFETLYNSEDDSHIITKINSKLIVEEKNNCRKILLFLENQIKN